MEVAWKVDLHWQVLPQIGGGQWCCGREREKKQKAIVNLSYGYSEDGDNILPSTEREPAWTAYTHYHHGRIGRKISYLQPTNSSVERVLMWAPSRFGGRACCASSRRGHECGSRISSAITVDRIVARNNWLICPRKKITPTYQEGIFDKCKNKKALIIIIIIVVDCWCCNNWQSNKWRTLETRDLLQHW